MIKILIFSLILGIILIVLKNVNYEFFVVASVLSGIFISIYVFKIVYEEVLFIKNLVNISGVSTSIYKIILKIVGIGYLTEFSSQTLNDFGLQSLSNKVILAGKVNIIYVALPIFSSLVSLITSLCA